MSSILEITDIRWETKGHSILNGISLAVETAGLVGLIGPNGSGKTTLFNVLSGFLHGVQGTIKFKGQDISNVVAYSRARLGIGRVFQNSGVFRSMTVLENMLLGFESNESGLGLPFGPKIRAKRARALELLNEVGLRDKIDAKASSLSGGQLRLLEIQRMVAFGATFFLLDEPTAGVSPKMKDDVANLILRLKAQGHTALVIEHDINFIGRFCDQIVVLESGRVVLSGDTQTVRSSELLKEIYLGSKDKEAMLRDSAPRDV